MYETSMLLAQSHLTLSLPGFRKFMHVVVWRNKPDLGSISFDDLYNKFKIVEQEVKRSVTSSSNSNSQNVAFVSTPSSTNDVNTSNVLVNTASYDKTKVECFNCHKMRHFARECMNPKSQEIRSRNQDNSRRTVNVEKTSSKPMLAIDGVGFDCSFMTEEEVPTIFDLMAFSDLELNKSKSDLANYKRGLASVEEQLVFYKKNEGMLCDQIDVFKRDASFNESEINALKIQIERLKKEKESNQIKIDKFENAFKCLDKLIRIQISENNRKGVGYNAVAPPPTGLFTPPTIDLSNSGLEEFKHHEFEGYGVKDETLEKVSDSANVQKPKQADQPKKVSQNPRNNSTNWNTPMSRKLGVGMIQKPVLNNVKKGTGQREVRPVWNNAMRTNHQIFSNSRRNFAPTAILTKSGLVPISTARQSSSRTTTVSTAIPIKIAAP
ncbi:putative ribonuclease H-like domain-containing protein, partial [Tanacetum coccineum]